MTLDGIDNNDSGMLAEMCRMLLLSLARAVDEDAAA